jgi:ribosomal protein S18 acetylase RimI-like enzyme
MKTTFGYAGQKHFEWLQEKDSYIDADTLKKKILDKQIIVAESGKQILGWLRFGFFWDSIPFMNMLFIGKDYRKMGIGRKMVQFWERDMRKQNKTIVMTSSQSDEEAQHFYRKLGYTDVGALTLPEEPEEIIFIKKLM